MMVNSLNPRNPKSYVGKLDKNKPPLSTWWDSHDFYGGPIDGGYTVSTKYQWDTNVPEYIVAPGLEECAHLQMILSGSAPNGVSSTYDHYFAGGSALEKIRSDFKNSVSECWTIARKLDSDFPSRTIIDFNEILDPFIDNQPRYFRLESYAEVGCRRLKIGRTHPRSISSFVNVRGETPKRNTSIEVQMGYDETGELASCDCLVQRRAQKMILRMRSSKGKMFVRQIQEWDSEWKWWTKFEATSYGAFKKKCAKRGIQLKAE